MPYITQQARDPLEAHIRALSSSIIENASGDLAGAVGSLNYAVTRVLLQVMRHYGPLKYSSLSLMCGVIDNIKQEFYRRVVDPYENGKSLDNGDVPEYVNPT